MMEKGNFILLYRQMIEWEWYKDTTTKSLFLHLLLKAAWKDVTYNGIALKRGQLLTTEKELSEETGLSRQQVRTAMSHLVATKEVTKGLTKHLTTTKTLVTIENYSVYQGESIGYNQASNQRSNQGSNHELTKGQPEVNQPTIYINKENNINNINNNIPRARARHTDGVSISNTGERKWYTYQDTMEKRRKNEMQQKR